MERAHDCRCPDCGRLLGKMRVSGTCVVLFETFCKGCKRLVTVAVIDRAA